MSFLDALNWLAAHVPSFLRPAVSWLIEGLRAITSYISTRWNTVGRAVNSWLVTVLMWAAITAQTLARLGTFAVWLVRVRIPGAIAATASSILSALSVGLQALRDFTTGLVSGVVSWIASLVNDVKALLFAVEDFARQWIERIRVTVSALITALSHVLQGPEVLAEWLAAAMIRAMLRFVAGQRDRIALWLTRESVAFTQWLAGQVEDIILRWL